MGEDRSGMEVDIIRYWRVVWRLKAVTASVVIAGTILVLAVTLMMPEVYRAEAVITPVQPQDGAMSGGIGALAQQFGGLAGISLPDSGSTAEIVSLLDSNILREKVLGRKGMMQMIFADRWDAEAGQWTATEGGSFLSPLMARRSFAVAAPSGGTAPTVWEGIRRLKEMVSVVQSARESTITISADSGSAGTSARTVEYILDTLNEHMSGEAQRVARVNRAYLESQLKTASDPIIRQKIYGLVARQIEMDMMAEVKENFAFKVIDPPMAPDQRISPRRTRMVAAGAAASLIIGIFAAFFWDFAQRQKHGGASSVMDGDGDGA